MKTEKLVLEPRSVWQSLRAQPLLFVGSALGLLVLAVLKGGWGGRRAASSAK